MGQVFELSRRLVGLGCEYAYFKILGPNNNSKQQVYLAGDLRDLNWLPHGEVTQAVGSSRKPRSGGPILHVAIDLFWLTADGPERAPHAQLIAYPQYPEVRLSGLLRDSPGAPSELLRIDQRGKEPGRVLLLAPWGTKGVIAALVGPETEAAAHVRRLAAGSNDLIGRWALSDSREEPTLESLLGDLADVVAQGWIQGERMRPDRVVVPYNARNAGGYTLEARLGIPSNADPAADVNGVGELKQVGRASGRLTLMDLPPVKGAFCDLVPLEFFKRFGRETKHGRRMDFTFARSRGHRFEYRHGDPEEGVSDAFVLSTGDAVIGEWPLAHVASHWTRKHRRTVVVQSEMARDKSGFRLFRYLPTVWIHEGARLGRLMEATEAGHLRIDPGCRIERRSDDGWGDAKTRFGFRIATKHLGGLYERSEKVDVSARRR